MFALALFSKLDLEKTSSTDVLATLVFCSALAAGACVLIYSRWGRKWRLRQHQRAIESEDRVRLNARKGKVQPPVLWQPPVPWV
jgi:hypothetical protein